MGIKLSILNKEIYKTGLGEDMRTALCLIGKVGGTDGKDMKGDTVDFEECYKTYKKHIIDVNNADVFIHSWSIEHEKKLRKLYKPKKALFQPQIKFKVKKGNKQNARYRANSRWYSNKQSLFLKKQYEEENGFKYDCVMVCRLDVMFFVDFVFSKLNLNYFYSNNWNTPPLETKRKKNGKLNKPDKINRSETRDGYGDFFYISNTDMMDKFSTLYDNLPEYSHSQHKASWQHVNSFANARDISKYVLYRWFDFELYRWKICHCYK